jgi:hypothetical protein
MFNNQETLIRFPNITVKFKFNLRFRKKHSTPEQMQGSLLLLADFISLIANCENSLSTVVLFWTS